MYGTETKRGHLPHTLTWVLVLLLQG